MAGKRHSTFVSPVSKLAVFFEKSRDGWKAKHQESKQSAKLLANQARAVEKSREKWRSRASLAEKRVAELEYEIEQLKSHRARAGQA